MTGQRKGKPMTSAEEDKDKGPPTHRVTLTSGVGLEFGAGVSADPQIPAEHVEEFRPEFLEALSLLAQVCDEVVRRRYPRPILVGGAAVEFYTSGEVTSGDVDFVTRDHDVFEEILPEYGFRFVERLGRRMRRFQHPTLDLGVEVVSDHLYPGSDPARIRLIKTTGGERIAIYPVEDLIADRLRQHAEEDRAEMLGQATRLYQLATELDEAYLNTRIREQTNGEWSLGRLKQEAA
jgi:hypothetical protein